MYTINGLLFLIVLIPLTSFAAKEDFDFSIGGKSNSFDSTCIESIQYVEKDEVYTENLIMRFTGECGKRVSAITRQNIGKQMTISYGANKLTSALIVSRLGISIRISTNDIPRVLLMQILNDYGASRE